MEYGLDLLVEIMAKLSKKKPVFFQRDGSLYIISDAGIGMVNYGLNLNCPKDIEPKSSLMRYGSADQRADVPREFLESDNLILSWQGKYDPKPVFARGEEKYLDPMIYHNDDTRFTLEDMAKTADILRKLPDKKRVRMVEHGSQYHSHEYSFDTVDIFLTRARSIGIKTYFELMREEEKKFYKEVARYVQEGAVPDYRRIHIPNFTIVTPNLVLSFPVAKEWNGAHLNAADRDEYMFWDRETKFHAENGNILHLAEFSIFNKESPFTVFFQISGRTLLTQTNAEFDQKVVSTFRSTFDEIKTISLMMPALEQFLADFNQVHNNACKSEIERWQDSDALGNKKTKKPKKKKLSEF